VRDIKNTTSSSGADVVVQQFSQHPIVNPLMRSELQMLYPRPVSAVNSKNPSPDAPEVTELTFSGRCFDAQWVIHSGTAKYPLMVAVEQKNVLALLIPVADAHGRGWRFDFLNNQVIEGGTGGANRDFWVTQSIGCWTGQHCFKALDRSPSLNFGLTLTATQQAGSKLAIVGRAARRGFAVWRIGLARAKKIMNSKTTGIWFVVAAALGIFIFAFEHYFHFAASAQAGILPRLQLMP